MIVRCPDCDKLHDDARCWAICPHGPLEFALKDYCPKCDTLVTLHGECIHQKEKVMGLLSGGPFDHSINLVVNELPPCGICKDKKIDALTCDRDDVNKCYILIAKCHGHVEKINVTEELIKAMFDPNSNVECRPFSNERPFGLPEPSKFL